MVKDYSTKKTDNVAAWRKRMLYPAWLGKQLEALGNNHGALPDNFILKSGDLARDRRHGFSLFLREQFPPHVEDAIRDNDQLFRMVFMGFILRTIYEAKHPIGVPRLPLDSDSVGAA